jgi:hypothetical protein
VVSATPADTVAPAAVRDLSLGPDGTNAVDLALALLEEHRGLEY